MQCRSSVAKVDRKKIIQQQQLSLLLQQQKHVIAIAAPTDGNQCDNTCNTYQKSLHKIAQMSRRGTRRNYVLYTYMVLATAHGVFARKLRTSVAGRWQAHASNCSQIVALTLLLLFFLFYLVLSFWSVIVGALRPTISRKHDKAPCHNLTWIARVNLITFKTFFCRSSRYAFFVIFFHE